MFGSGICIYKNKILTFGILLLGLHICVYMYMYIYLPYFSNPKVTFFPA